MPRIAANGLQLHVQQAGSGPDVILIHGLTGDLSIWFLCRAMVDLAVDHRVTAYDLRGHGYSDVPPTGCQAGPESGPKVQYIYSAATCDLALGTVSLVGATRLDLGPASFYIRTGDVHVVAFPAVSVPGSCVVIKATPLSAFTAGRLVSLARLMRPRS